ncbi:hypothetical protein Lalb_Chr02g0151661 [Lupinus albus]|uniref:Uncharacterized protein n=1 Tax=Lupinus albus TaxID=3870 RepID=A0A6A4R117_LUPAL|nr:hypothetical protein Lalb_Chr02g0151661 [Lupinus albus]
MYSSSDSCSSSLSAQNFHILCNQIIGNMICNCDILLKNWRSFLVSHPKSIFHLYKQGHL